MSSELILLEAAMVSLSCGPVLSCLLHCPTQKKAGFSGIVGQVGFPASLKDFSEPIYVFSCIQAFPKKFGA